MAKRTIRKESPMEEQYLNQHVQWRASGIAGVVLALLLIFVFWIWPQIFGKETPFSRAVQAGLNLFLIWLVVTSTVRTVHHIRPRIELWRLYIAGMVTALLGVILKELFWSGGELVRSGSESVSFSFEELMFYIAVALIASSIALIRLRVRDRKTGQFLEIALIGVVAFLFFYFMK